MKKFMVILLCGWWGVMFLLRYDFSMPKNKITPFAENITVSLPPPTLVLQAD